jgi:hypothetical protein
MDPPRFMLTESSHANQLLRGMVAPKKWRCAHAAMDPKYVGKSGALAGGKDVVTFDGPGRGESQ